jgi:hypothetical protein
LIANTRFAKTEIILAKAVSERKNGNLEHFSTHDFYARLFTHDARLFTHDARHTTKTQTHVLKNSGICKLSLQLQEASNANRIINYRYKMSLIQVQLSLSFGRVSCVVGK